MTYRNGRAARSFQVATWLRGARRVRRVADRLDGALAQGRVAGGELVRRRGLPGDEAVAVAGPLEVRGRGGAAQVAVDAVLVDEVAPRDVVGPAELGVGHGVDPSPDRISLPWLDTVPFPS